MANTGSNGLGIGDLSIGVSAQGMSEYVEKIRMDLLKDAREMINNVETVEAAINKGWQGASRDKFLTDFEAMRDQICTDLEEEFYDLEAKMEEVMGAYYDIDQRIMEQ